MARELKPFGYDIFTIDIQWYEGAASGYDYSTKPIPTMDEHGATAARAESLPIEL